jgi:hypothetical protein
MKKYILNIIISSAMILTFACQSDEENKAVDKLPSIDEISNKTEVNTTEINEEIGADSIIETEAKDISENKPDQIDKEKKIKEEAAKIRRAKDIDDLIPTYVNTRVNPDNLNMAFEAKRKESHVKLYPILLEDEKEYYHIQFLVSVNKYSLLQLEEIFPDSVVVYVTSHKGLYKYAIGQFKTPDQARSKINDFKEKYNLGDAVLAYYGEAF